MFNASGLTVNGRNKLKMNLIKVRYLQQVIKKIDDSIGWKVTF
jgi:hypothetical protein